MRKLGISRRLGSVKLALALLLISLLILVLGTLSSLRGQGSPVWNSTIYYSPWFVGFAALVLVNLSFCTFRQLKVLWTRLQSVKGRVNWGSPIMHLGLVLALAGGLLDFATGFTGSAIISENTVFSDQTEGYGSISRGIWSAKKAGEFTVFLEKVKITSSETGLHTEGLLQVVQGGKPLPKQWIAHGQPVYTKLYNFYFDELGFDLNLKIKGKQAEGEQIVLRVRPRRTSTGSGNLTMYQGDFILPHNAGQIFVQFSPDKAGTPVFHQAVYKNSAGRTEYSGVPAFSRPIALPSGSKLVFESCLPWLSVNVKQEPGMYIVLAGSIVMIAGVFALYLRGVK